MMSIWIRNPLRISITGPILGVLNVIYLYFCHDYQSLIGGQQVSQHLPIQLNMT